MKLFIDTANVVDIQNAYDMGVISGVTTNPSLVAKEGRDFKTMIREIANIVDGPVSAEVISLKQNQMIKEAQELAAIHDNIVIKLPMTSEGLKTCKTLSGMGIKTNMTLIFSAAQALLAANAGAAYVSPFVGRLDDIDFDGISLIEEIADIFKVQGISSQIIAASIRNPLHVTKAARAGAHIATVPYTTILQMVKHPLTDLGIIRFLKDWETVKENKKEI